MLILCVSFGHILKVCELEIAHLLGHGGGGCCASYVEGRPLQIKGLYCHRNVGMISVRINRFSANFSTDLC